MRQLEGLRRGLFIMDALAALGHGNWKAKGCPIPMMSAHLHSQQAALIGLRRRDNSKPGPVDDNSAKFSFSDVRLM